GAGAVAGRWISAQAWGMEGPEVPPPLRLSATATATTAAASAPAAASRGEAPGERPPRRALRRRHARGDLAARSDSTCRCSESGARTSIDRRNSTSSDSVRGRGSVMVSFYLERLRWSLIVPVWPLLSPTTRRGDRHRQRRGRARLSDHRPPPRAGLA